MKMINQYMQLCIKHVTHGKLCTMNMIFKKLKINSLVCNGYQICSYILYWNVTAQRSHEGPKYDFVNRSRW